MISQSQVKRLGTDQAAGSEVSETVPAGASWGLVAVSLSLVQGLTQTPQPILTIDDGTDIIFQAPGASAAQAVSTTCRYNWAAGLTLSAILGSGANCFAFAPLPRGLILPAGSRVRTNTLGIGANSDYGPPVLWIVNYGS